MSASAGNKKKPPIRWIVPAIAGAVIILVLAAAAFFFIRYRNAGARHVDLSQSQVFISQPANMAQFPMGHAIQVAVNASGLKPFTSTELWINGVLEGVQAAPSGLTMLGASFTWIPPSSGNFALVARAINQDGDTIVSSAVFVFVNPAETGNQPDAEAGKVYPVVYPAAPGGNASPQPPSSGEPVTPAGNWQGSPANWVTDLTAGSAPAAPKLVVSADGCKIKLDIYDFSDNEEGFAVYRQTTENQNWVHVADLASHPGQGWIQTQEANLTGGITYYVDAFNSKGKNSSNLALVNIDPDACPSSQPAAPAPVLDLRVQNLSIGDGIVNPYCYMNPGGDQWSRWPEMGFLPSGGQDVPLLTKPLVLASLDDNGVNPGPQSLALTLECWGWQGGKVMPLGKFSQKLDLVSIHAVHVALTGMAFDILPDVIHGLKYETFKLETSINTWISLVKDPYDVENLGYVPESDQLPMMSAWLTYITSECQDHILDPEYKDMLCYPMPGFDAGPSGLNPQPYLVWSPVGAICKGYATKQCFNLAWWEGFAKKYPALYNPGVHFIVENYFLSGGNGTEGNQVEDYQMAWRVLPDTPASDSQLCFNGYRIFDVIMDVNTSLGEFQSKSPMVAVPCTHPAHSVQVEITFDSMDIENIDDGVNDSTADNVYGQWTGRVNGQLGATLLVGWWGGQQPGSCTWGQWCNGGQGSNGYIENLDDGFYSLAGFQLCLQGRDDCDFNLYANYFYNNNKLVVTLHDGDSLQLVSELYDYDQSSSDDAICNADLWVGPRSLGQWETTMNESYNLVAPGGDANCNVHVILNAVGTGQ
jgi:hypothetical protein